MAAGSLRVSWQAEGFAEVAEQATDAVGGALMAAGFAFPAAFFGIIGELPLQAQAFAKSWRVLGGGDELGAREVEVAFAWAARPPGGNPSRLRCMRPP
jgi:hypothetical protein